MTNTPIKVAYPNTEDLHLRIALAACHFKAEPGEGEAWITGTCYDPTGKRPHDSRGRRNGSDLRGRTILRAPPGRPRRRSPLRAGAWQEGATLRADRRDGSERV